MSTDPPTQITRVPGLAHTCTTRIRASARRTFPTRPRCLTPVPLDYAAPVEEFLKIWNVDGWNQFHIRCTGEVPDLTTWINGVKIAELDTARMKAPKWDPKTVLELVGRTGHVALEVHSKGAKDRKSVA